MTLSAQAALTNAIFKSDTCSKFRGRKPEENDKTDTPDDG